LSIIKPERIVPEYALYAFFIEPEIPKLTIDAVAVKPEFEFFFVYAILEFEPICSIFIALVSFSFTIEQQ
tara:strand:+ start:100 stop:309 length:210 start_codon:yes stop_codon:yes gene_type:complete